MSKGTLDDLDAQQRRQLTCSRALFGILDRWEQGRGELTAVHIGVLPASSEPSALHPYDTATDESSSSMDGREDTFSRRTQLAEEEVATPTSPSEEHVPRRTSGRDSEEMGRGMGVIAVGTYLSVVGNAGVLEEDTLGPQQFILIEKRIADDEISVDASVATGITKRPKGVRHGLQSRAQAARTREILSKIPYALRIRIPLLEPLAYSFGAAPVAALFLSYFLVKGIGAHLVSSGTLPIFKDVFKVSGGRYQAFVTITILGWSFKPILGLASDLIAVRGYNKKNWLVLAATLGAVGGVVFAALPGPSSADEAKTAWFVGISVFGAICAFFISVSQAALDLLFEGFYCTLMQQAPNQSSSLISWVWGATMAGGLVAASLEGPIADHLSPRVVIGIVVLSFLLVLPVLVGNWIGEVPFLRIVGGYYSGCADRGPETTSTDLPALSSVTPPNGSSSRESGADAIEMGEGDAMDEPEREAVRHSLISEHDHPHPNSTATPSLANRPQTTDVTCAVVEPLACIGLKPDQVPTFIVLSSKAMEHKKVVMYASLMGVSAIAIAISTLHFSSLASEDDNSAASNTTTGGGLSRGTIGKLQLLGVTATASVVLCFFSFKALPRAIASANVFMFLKEMLYVQMPGPLDFFFTAGPSCVPNGPNFSYTYYQTFTSIVGYLAGAGGVAIFYRYFSKRSFQTTFYITTAIRVLASLFDLMLVTRTNQTFFQGWIWPFRLLQEDKVFYFLGDAIVYQAVTMMDFMPMVMLTSKMCPKGLECTTYAILAGFSNFGQVISNTIGSLLVAFVFPIVMSASSGSEVATATGGASTATTGCDFSNLPYLLIVGHLLMPLLVIPLIPLLVPSQRMDEGVSH